MSPEGIGGGIPEGRNSKVQELEAGVCRARWQVCLEWSKQEGGKS